MSEVLLFTKPDCQKCEYVKERLPDGLDIKIIDATSVDGMAEAAFYELLDKPTPVLVIDGEVITGAINILNRLRALADGQV